MRTLFRLISVAVVLLTVALISALVTMQLAVHGHEVAVPKLVGMAKVEAEHAAKERGLSIQISRQFYSTQIPEGRVVSQAPEPGAMVLRGWQVQAAESLGPQRVTVPDVTGESLRAAEINLQQRGLEIGDQSTAEIPGGSDGLIAAQNPPPSARNISAPKVSVLISAGGDVGGAFVMPDFTGQPLAIVSHDIVQAGLKVGSVTVNQMSSVATPNPSDASQKATLILSHTPAAGEKVSKGGVVNFVVTR